MFNKMMMKIKNKRGESGFLPKSKKGMSLSIVLLVFATVILMGSSLVIFKIRANQMSVENSFIDIQDVYVEYELMDFYINEIMEDVTRDFYYENGKTVFISKFKNELGKYKAGNKNLILEIEGIENQLSEDRIVLSLNKVSIKLDFNVVKEFSNATVSYSESKTFERYLLSFNSRAYIGQNYPQLTP